jgi:polyhydroxyalkanoate synthesis repressor PhaR
MGHPRIIKKYLNRRLYDCEQSRYITLEDICRLVRDHVDFTVIDPNDTDVTCKVLLQAVIAQEEGRHPTLRREQLTRLIRSAAN